MGFSGFKDMLEISGMLVGKYWMLSKWYRSGIEVVTRLDELFIGKVYNQKCRCRAKGVGYFRYMPLEKQI